MSQTETLLHDRYSIVHVERIGSFSKVFFALDNCQTPPRSCIIKVFEPIVQKIKIAKWIDEEFQKEVKRLKQLSLHNQYLPEIYTYSNEFQAYFIVRELIEGKTFRETVQAQGKFSTIEVREILLKLLSVLDYLHQAGVIHQNIKPKNIILRDDDLAPMLINFGSVKQIVATYGFYGDKQIFSSNNVHGYAAAEQALGRSVPASDLYSLGLTAVYLLTGKNPVDLAVDSNSGNFKLPPRIFRQDSELAAIIARAISPNVGDRYNSADEMTDALLQSQSATDAHFSGSLSKSGNTSQKISQESEARDKHSNWWKVIIFAASGLYIMVAAITALYDWKFSQNSPVGQLLEPTIPLITYDPPSPKPSELSQPVVEQPSMLNSQSENLIEIPIFATGTQKQQLRNALGEPDAIQPGYWANSSAWIYKEQADGSIDLGYLFDLNTNELKQTEVAIAPSIGLVTIQEIMNSMLQGQITPSVNQELQKIYQGQAKKYSFRLGNLEGSIEREADNQIYLGVWETDFH